MKPPSFDYVAPRTIGEVVALLQHHAGDAKILAGGQSLMPLLNMRFARPSLLIDLNKLPGLDYIREADGMLAVGALIRQRALERSPLVKKRQPLIDAALRFVSHPQIRNRGTVCGSLAHADPAAELPAVATALEAQFVATGPQGTRTIAASDFFVTIMTTALEPAEMLTEVRFPVLPDRTGWSCLEVTRRHGDFALAGAAVTVTLDGAGKCAAARIALFGVGYTPLRARAAEQALVGEKPDDQVLERAAAKARAQVTDAVSDVHASREYRQYLAGVVTRRTLAEAAQRAGGGR